MRNKVKKKDTSKNREKKERNPLKHKASLSMFKFLFCFFVDFFPGQGDKGPLCPGGTQKKQGSGL